jgi:hypothetical protein
LKEKGGLKKRCREEAARRGWEKEEKTM